MTTPDVQPREKKGQIGSQLIPPITVRAALVDLSVAVLVTLGMQFYVSRAIYRSDWLLSFGDTAAWIISSVINLMVFLTTINFLLRQRGLKWSSIGIVSERIERTVFLAILCAVLANIAEFLKAYVFILFQQRVPMIQWRQHAAYEQATELAAVHAIPVIALFIITAIGEEIVFRGLILTRLRRLTARWWSAVLISSLFFALLHLENGVKYASGAFVLSVTLSVFYIASGSLITVSLAHALYNFSHWLLMQWLRSEFT